MDPTVVLIDRQPLFLAALGSLLSSPPVNAHVQIASGTTDGLEMALAGNVHLVFCEVKAEPIPAVELADRLSDLIPSVPLILLGEPDDVSAIRQHGLPVIWKYGEIEYYFGDDGRVNLIYTEDSEGNGRTIAKSY